MTTTVSIQNPASTDYLDYMEEEETCYPCLSSTNTQWDLNLVSNTFLLASPLDPSTPYQAFAYLTCDTSSVVSMNTYPGVNSIMVMTQDGSGYWQIKSYVNSTLGNTLYLRTDSNGVLSFTSTIDDSAKWTRASDGTNYKFQNRNYTTLYLQSMSNGHVAQASSYVSNNQFDWTMNGVDVTTISINAVSGQYLFSVEADPPATALGALDTTGYYYWVRRPIPGLSAGNYYFESVGLPGQFLLADTYDMVPALNSVLQYSDQTANTQYWLSS